MTPKERLIKLHREIHGGDINLDDTELCLIIDIIETLKDTIEDQENHTHNIN